MNKYLYDGPVMYFDNYIERHWKGSTYAVSENKAKNNLTHQYKKNNKMAFNAKITLPGKMIMAQ